MLRKNFLLSELLRPRQEQGFPVTPAGTQSARKPCTTVRKNHAALSQLRKHNWLRY